MSDSPTLCPTDCSCDSCQILKDLYAEGDPQSSYFCPAPNCTHEVTKHEIVEEIVQLRIQFDTTINLYPSQLPAHNPPADTEEWLDWLHKNLMQDGMNFLDTRFTKTKISMKGGWHTVIDT